MKKYYAANNSYASETSQGFSNTWYVYAFATKATRDEWVRSKNNMAAMAITRKEVTRYAVNEDGEGPRPFSGEFWGIVDYKDESPSATIPGFVGEVMPCQPDQPGLVGRFYS